MRKTFKLGAIVTYGGGAIGTLTEAAEELREEGIEVQVRAATPSSDLDWEGFFRWLAEEADAFFLLGGNPEEYGGLLKTLSARQKVVVTKEPGRSTVPPEHVAKLERYYKYGGKENLKNFILYLGKLAGFDFRPGEPEEVPWQGIYHPKLGVFEEPGRYKREYEKRLGLRPEVGLLFYRSYWLDGNLALVDALVGELEGRGIGVIPVFGQGTEDKKLGSPGNREALKLLEGVEVVVNLQSFSLVPRNPAQEESPLSPLNVPVLQGLKEYYRTEEEWREDPKGISPLSQVMCVAQPEFDGTIEPLLLAARKDVRLEGASAYGSYQVYAPIPDRIRYLADRIEGWLRLKQVPREKRRVTFVLHNSPCKGLEATVGRGAGLDTLESVVRIMRQLREAGYRVERVPEDGKALIDMIMEKKAISEFRWTTVDEIVRRGGVLEFVGREKYERWFSSLPEESRRKVLEAWGEPPGEGMVYEGQILVTGLRFGNVNVVVQPKRGCYGARCDGRVCKILHDPEVPPPHHWIATYKWIQENSDVIVHVGTHGYLEFLPGKGVGLSEEDFPEISIGNKPHFYIYTVKNPMEGAIAKRRSYATLVDHMIPVMTPSGLYDELEELDELLRQYEDARSMGEEARAKVLEEEISKLAERAHLEDDDFRRLHEKLAQIRETTIPYGLHILSCPPEGEALVDLIVSVLRFDGEVPSIRRKVLEVQGMDYERALEDPAHGRALDEATDVARELIRTALEGGDIEGKVRDLLDVAREEGIPELLDVVKFALKLVPRVRAVSREIPQLLRGFEKEFIEPGPSGNVTRGRTEVLPTGRNFYTVDPWRVPTKAAWEVGRKLTERMLEKFLSEEGRYPEAVGMVLWSTDAYRTDGEEVAQILYLMGARPKWEGGRVKGVEIVPLEELGRPRIDPIIRLSGIFRDTLPHIYELLDEAVQMVMDLDEPPDANYLRKHAQEMREKVGEESARFRIFCARPGTYGAGVNLAVEASAWEDGEDLKEVYVDWGGYAYGKGLHGRPAHESFALNLKNVEVTYNKLGTDESDALDCCCYFAYHGGMTAAAKGLSGREVKTYWGDTRDPDRPKVRDMKEEIERIVRTRLLNPKWLEGMMRHGYKGAGDISSRVVHLYGWDATAGIVEDWVYDEVHRRIVVGMKDWFMEHNPHALEEIARRLLEANRRGMWDADEETLDQLRSVYLELEGTLEDEVRTGDFQGGDVNVVGYRRVKDKSGRGGEPFRA